MEKVRLVLVIVVALILDCVVVGGNPRPTAGTQDAVVHPRWNHILSRDYEIITPIQVEHQDLTSESSGGSNRDDQASKIQRRERRSPDHNTTYHLKGGFEGTTDELLKGTLFYHIQSAVHSFVLQLEPSQEFLNKNFKVYKRSGGKEEQLASLTEDDCFYRGHVINHTSSRVSVSLCGNAMTALIETGNGTYMVEPVPEHLEIKLSRSQKNFTSGQTHHILYQTNHEPGSKFCAQDIHSGHRQTFESRSVRTRRSTNETWTKRSSKLNHHYHHHRRPYHHHQNHNIDTLVVVDSNMMKQHGQQNITNYVLTLFNMVSHLFSDNTIGSKINITLVALILLEGDEPGFVVSHQADSSLNNFCSWQSSLEGIQHDHAILLTGVDICSYKDEPCDTLGFAPIHGMCKKQSSCTINEDTGLGTAFTIAHEIGHNFGMYHDGEGNFCRESAGSIMSPTLLGFDGTFKWSACSRKYLNHFLRSSQAWCLEDKPQPFVNISFPDKLPGEMYDTSAQCQWQFGLDAKVCPFNFAKDLCKSLWCLTTGLKCETKFLPAAEGTKCDPGKWCRKGVCVPYGNDGPKPSDGGWSGFTPWSACSRSCGVGITFKERFCNSPRPRFGGKDCDGDTRVYKVCNTQECNSTSEDFRAMQCSTYNTKAFRGHYYKWLPYKQYVPDEDRCRLYCMASEYGFYFALANKVVDGTPCDNRTRDVCVEGVCSKVGCDGVVESGLKFDECGVCGGNGSSCEVTSGHLVPLSSNKSFSLHLPTGAYNISISGTSTSESFLAIKSTVPRTVKVFKTAFLPQNINSIGTIFTVLPSEQGIFSIHAAGPINNSVSLEFLMFGLETKINFSYTTPRRSLESNMATVVQIPTTTPLLPTQDNYTWTAYKSPCSSTCGTGERNVTWLCSKNLETEVDPIFCNDSTKPTLQLQTCAMPRCPPTWLLGEWQACSKQCSVGTQRRSVHCARRLTAAETKTMNPRICSKLHGEPIKRRFCNQHPCDMEWRTANWSKCSVSCGQGIRTRLVTCHNQTTGERLTDDACLGNLPRPNSTTVCQRKSICYKKYAWMLSSWRHCSGTCGREVRHRELYCSGLPSDNRWTIIPHRNCWNLPKPSLPLKEPCRSLECQGKWNSNSFQIKRQKNKSQSKADVS